MEIRRLLIVEDEIELADCLFEYFQGQFDEVYVAHSGPAAIEAFEKGKFSVIVSDYNLPGMDGLELLRFLRAVGDTTPVVWISGRAGKEEFREALKEGVFEFIEKPFQLEKLKEAVESALAFGVNYVKSKR